MMRRRSKELYYLLGGGLVGVVIGMLLMAANDDLRQDLFGASASNNDNTTEGIEIDPRAFYVVEYSQAQAWLASVQSEDYEAAWSVIGGIASTEQLSDYLPQADSSIQEILAALRQALRGDESLDNAQDAAFKTCLGLDRANDLTGPGLYIYVEVPPGLEDSVPDDWQALDSPKENSLLWSVECFKQDNDS